MASEQKIAANRNNAQKSTGPRSREGRQASSRNSLRHGLAIDIGDDPAFHDDIEKLAKALLLPGVTKVSEQVREAAEAQVDLLRIQKMRARLFETPCSAHMASPGGMTDLNDKLAKLERYERRAFSRRKRAMRAMGA